LKRKWFGKRTDPDNRGAKEPGPGEPGPGGSGRKIGKYEIVEQIGTGGFGTVYKGYDPHIKRYVAIKTCEVENPEIRERAFREAQLSGSLQHPNITTVFETGVDGDMPYIVQEFLAGEDLNGAIARGAPVTLQEKVKILIGIASGLEHAHEAGIVHRDIKPANIRLLPNGTVKIMDFGIAKSLDPSGDITKTGITVGSSSYMAPEQIVGDPVDRRTDIFSLGVLAYELLSSHKPFRHENLFKLLEMIVKEEPEPLETFVSDVPPALADIVRRAMCKIPADRFASAGELRAALMAAHQEGAGGPEPLAAGAPLPRDEEGRLAALGRLEVLDTEPEPEFDDLTRLASQLCGMPIALISLVDKDRQWSKSRVGLSYSETSRNVSFDAHAILGSDVLVVPDALADPRFSVNPLVLDEPKLRFYAGAPLVTSDGYAVGTLCVLDRVPRELSEEQIEGLRALSRQVMAQLELRRRIHAEREHSGEKLMMEIEEGVSGGQPSGEPGRKE
jgi:serine/threonine protein kinase